MVFSYPGRRQHMTLKLSILVFVRGELERGTSIVDAGEGGLKDGVAPCSQMTNCCKDAGEWSLRL